MAGCREESCFKFICFFGLFLGQSQRFLDLLPDIEFMGQAFIYGFKFLGPDPDRLFQFCRRSKQRKCIRLLIIVPLNPFHQGVDGFDQALIFSAQ